MRLCFATQGCIGFSGIPGRMSCCCISPCGGNYQHRVVPEAKELVRAEFAPVSTSTTHRLCFCSILLAGPVGPLNHTPVHLSPGNVRMFLQVRSDLALSSASLHFQLFYFILDAISSHSEPLWNHSTSFWYGFKRRYHFLFWGEIPAASDSREKL